MKLEAKRIRRARVKAVRLVAPDSDTYADRSGGFELALRDDGFLTKGPEVRAGERSLGDVRSADLDLRDD